MNVVNSVAPAIDDSAVELGIQLAISAGMVVVMVVFHSAGLVAISRVLDLRGERLERHAFNAGALGLLAGLGLLLFALHIAEIVAFALFYTATGALETMEDALFYSASAYATLGWTAAFFPDEWQLIGALESLIGFLLIGWSTAFMVSAMNHLRE